MLKSFATRAASVLNKSIQLNAARTLATTSSRASKVDSRSNEEIDKEIIDYLNQKDIDSWQLRKTLQTVHMRDAIPDPAIITAALQACRNQNDFALAVRFLETVQIKCGPHKKVVYPWLIEQIKPTLDQLGVPTPEEMGYDKPELYLESVYDM